MRKANSTEKVKYETEREALKRPDKADKDGTMEISMEEVRGLDTGWAWVVVFAAFGTFCLLGTSLYSVGIIQAVLLQKYGESVALTSWPGAVNTAMMSLGGPLSSAVVDRFSCRTAIVLSGLFLATGYFVTAFATNIYVTIVTYGVIAGIGGALGYTAALIVVGLNFRKRRYLAVGLAVSGVGAGLFVLAPILQISRDYYGVSGFFIILSAMMANIVMFGTLCFPSRLELWTQKQRMKEVDISVRKFKMLDTLNTYFEALSRLAIILLCMCMFFYCLGIQLIYQHLPNFIVIKGFTALQAAFLVSLSGLLTIFGRILAGIVTNLNRVNNTALYSGPMAIVAVASFLYPFASTYFTGHVIYMAVLGLFFGCPYVLIMAVTLKFVGIKYISAAIGIQYFSGGVGSVVGPVLAGFIVDRGATYEQSIIIAALCIAAAAIFSASTECFKQKDSVNKQDVEIEVCEKLQTSEQIPA